MTTQTVFVDVDTQYDFCDPQGALYVKGADRLTRSFAALTSAAVSRRLPLVGSVDSHAFDAWEFAGAAEAGPGGERPGFPPHCVKGTPGWLKLPGTLAPRARFVPNVPVAPGALDALVNKGGTEQWLFEKEVYSLFANPNAPALLDRLAPTDGAAPRFVVYGVALDYCVRAAAIGLVEYLRERGRAGEVWLVTDATAAVAEPGGADALAACDAGGVRRVTTAEALAALG